MLSVSFHDQHLVNEICDDVLVVFDVDRNMYIQKCQISNLSCPASLHVEGDKLYVEVQEEDLYT